MYSAGNAEKKEAVSGLSSRALFQSEDTQWLDLPQVYSHGRHHQDILRYA